jgi:phosphoribosylglycinamide formyltransferase 1
LFRIAVLISGNGSNLQSIIDNISNRNLACSLEVVISDKLNAFGLERAEKVGIKTYTFEKKSYGENLSQSILEVLDNKVDLIVLAGFLSVLKGEILDKFKGKIINIHPALIPSFCGSGMYGIKVHEKVIECGVKLSGCTVHFVDAGTDTGPIILQKSVPVYFKDNPKELQARVLEKEHEAIVEALGLIIEGRVRAEGKRVEIL